MGRTTKICALFTRVPTDAGMAPLFINIKPFYFWIQAAERNEEFRNLGRQLFNLNSETS